MSAEHTSPFVEPFVLRLWPSASPEAIHAVHVAVRKCGHLAEYALVLVASVLALAAILAVWVNRQALNTDNCVRK